MDGDSASATVISSDSSLCRGLFLLFVSRSCFNVAVGAGRLRLVVGADDEFVLSGRFQFSFDNQGSNLRTLAYSGESQPPCHRSPRWATATKVEGKNSAGRLTSFGQENSATKVLKVSRVVHVAACWACLDGPSYSSNHLPTL